MSENGGGRRRDEISERAATAARLRLRGLLFADVIFQDMDSALREHEDVVKQYMAAIIPANDPPGWQAPYCADHEQRLDDDTFQEHIAPNTTSDFAFKGVLRDTASAVWCGMIRVEEGA